MSTLAAPPAAAEHHAESALWAAEAAVAARRARLAGPRRVVASVLRYQAGAALRGETAVARILGQQDIRSAADAVLNSLAFTTEVDRLLAMIEATAETEFDRLVESLVQDAGRAAESVSVAVRPDIRFVRYLTLPSCARCAVLAGRVYRYSQGFLRHPNCFPAGTVVSGPGAHGATRRWYEGELVTVRTAGGKQFSVTGNHPVLTAEGWLPANLLREGGDVVGRASGDRSSALVVPDHDQMPARIEDVWSADDMRPAGRVPVAPEDFHGDGLGGSHVDAVLADGLLREWVEPTLLQQMRQQLLAIRAVAAVTLAVAGADLQLAQGGAAALPGGMGRLGLSTALRSGRPSGPQKPCFAGVSDGHLGFHQAAANQHPRQSGALSDRVLALTGQVVGDDRRGIDGHAPSPRWDAPSGEFSTQNRAGYAERGSDLRERLAGQVEIDRVIEVRRIGWSGHVYNLTSSEGWYDANGIIVSNCDCVILPTTVAAPDLVQDPAELAKAGQIRGLSRADLLAVEQGADFGQVVNVRLRKAGLRQAGRVLARRGRLTPEGIYARTNTREEAVAALRVAGYLL